MASGLMSKVTGFRVLLETAHTSPGWCWTSSHEMRAGPGVLESGGPGGQLFRITSVVLTVSEKEEVVVAMKVLPGEGEMKGGGEGREVGRRGGR
jgi:hypothetical protein